MRLPLSYAEIRFRALDGHAEALLADLPVDRPAAAGIAVVEALAERTDGEPLRGADLPLTDFELTLAALRREHLGDTVTSEPVCSGCGERNEVSFSLGELAESVVAAIPADGATIAAEFGLRLPSAGDVAATGDGRRLLAACLEAPLPAARHRQAERAMARCAPLLSRRIAARCAYCDAALEAVFHLPGFVVAELVWQARAVFDDVHLLARGYGWREADILDLPRQRRRRYAARLREAA